MEVKNWGICDLSINRSFDLKELNKLKKIGINTVAINTVVEEVSDEPKKKKKRGDSKVEKGDFIPAPLEIPQDIKDECKLNILQRLTLEYSDTSISHKINHSENIKKYDIFAVIPKTSQAFQYACSSLDVDIITFQPQIKLPFKLNRKLYNQAAERGIYFELMYSPAIMDPTARKNIIATAHMFHSIGKSKNIVLSSGSSSYTLVRSVHDIMNLGFILGLNIKKSLEVVRDNARKVILKAQSRRCGKHFMLITKVEEPEIKTDDQ